MKHRMQLKGLKISFRDPFIIYDTIPIYDKSKQEYCSRKRSTAISFSDNGEIMIANTICSNKDTFTKKIARQILMGRLTMALEHYIHTSIPPCLNSYSEGTYLFDSLDTFEQFCNTFDEMGRQFFAPYNVKYAGKLTNHPKKYRVDRISDIYLHREFVSKTWAEFADPIELEETGLDTSTFDRSSEERDCNHTVSAR